MPPSHRLGGKTGLHEYITLYMTLVEESAVLLVWNSEHATDPCNARPLRAGAFASPKWHDHFRDQATQVMHLESIAVYIRRRTVPRLLSYKLRILALTLNLPTSHVDCAHRTQLALRNEI